MIKSVHQKIILLLILAAQNGSAQFYMSGPVTFPCGGTPRSATCADFNQDGKADLAVSHDITTNNVRILTGVGTGSFVSSGTVTVGELPWAIASADMNSDGKVDLITANSDSNYVAIALGNGNGTFLPYTRYTVTNNPINLCIADFNLDGHPDVATANYNNGSGTSVAVLLGSSSGALSPATYFSIGYGGVNLTSTDFNNDGKPDLAVVQDGPSVVYMLHGDGQGGFTPAGTFTVGWYPLSITAADFNEDGVMDVATANSSDNTVSILIGNGSGGFLSARNFYAVLAPYVLVNADFNKDGHADLAVAKSASSDSVVVFLGLGNGYFCKGMGYPVSTYAEAMALGDFNNDGRPDLAVPTWLYSQMQILISKYYPLPVTGDSLVCRGQSSVLSTPVNHHSGYYWTGPAPDTNVIDTGISITVHLAGVYTLHTNKSCADFTKFTLHVDSIKASFVATTTLGIPPCAVSFVSTSQAPLSPITNYSWSLGNGVTQNGNNSFANTTYYATGVYTATLVVTDVLGCADSTTRDLSMINLVVPNVFTPNGDNINDEFFVKTYGITNIECSIYDRWGLKIHEWNGMNGGWNGKTDADIACTDGTYYYVVKYSDSSALPHVQTGYIQLQR